MALLKRRGMVMLGLFALPLVVFAGPSAVADTGCGSSNTGWFPYDVRTDVIIVNQNQHNERAVELNLTNDQVSDHSYASIGYGYKSGDQTWVDRSYNGGRTWTQCGPFTRSYSNTLSNIGNSMRACWRPVDYPQSYCTAWYYDKD